jgi:hypothetical protein
MNNFPVNLQKQRVETSFVRSAIMKIGLNMNSSISAVFMVVRSQGRQPAAIFCPFEHPTLLSLSAQIFGDEKNAFALEQVHTALG